MRVWILAVIGVLVSVFVLPGGEAAKGSLRAGVLSRNSMRRKNSRNYNDGRMDYDGYDQGYGSHYRRRGGTASECNEVCQYNRLMGLEDGTNDDSNDADESSEVSSIAPCVGLCHVERVQELEKDKELKMCGSLLPSQEKRGSNGSPT